MFRYVPPALRNKQASEAEEAGTERDLKKGYTIKEICHQFDYPLNEASTLNGGRRLAFILLFGDQHPQWPPKIFCKSNLHLLSMKHNPSISSDIRIDAPHPPSLDPMGEKSKLPTKPVPLFTQDRALQQQGRSNGQGPFDFSGMYIISSVDYLQPRSQELVNLLDIKFKGGKERTPESWHQSLSMKWAVAEWRRDDSTTNPIVPLKVFKTKGVTEMLAEMRLREVSKDNTTKMEKENVKLQKECAELQKENVSSQKDNMIPQKEAAVVQGTDDQKDLVTVEEA